MQRTWESGGGAGEVKVNIKSRSKILLEFYHVKFWKSKVLVPKIKCNSCTLTESKVMCHWQSNESLHRAVT